MEQYPSCFSSNSEQNNTHDAHIRKIGIDPVEDVLCTIPDHSNSWTNEASPGAVEALCAGKLGRVKKNVAP